MKIAWAVTLALLLVGCGENSEVETAALRQRIFSLENQISEQARISDAAVAGLQRENRMLQEQNLVLSARLTQVTNILARTQCELTTANQSLASIAEREQRHRERLAKAKAARQKRQKEALNQIREANQPAAQPFRIFDAIFIGSQFRNGMQCDYGRFSIRNYTDKHLKGRAYAGCTPLGESIDVPPNSSREAIYIPANKDHPLRINCNLGNQTVEWDKQ